MDFQLHLLQKMMNNFYVTLACNFDETVTVVTHLNTMGFLYLGVATAK